MPATDLSISELARRCSESFRRWSEDRVRALDQTMGAALGFSPFQDSHEPQPQEPFPIQTGDPIEPLAVSSSPELSKEPVSFQDQASEVPTMTELNVAEFLPTVKG